MKKNTLVILLIVFALAFTFSSCEKATNAGPGYETFYVSASNAVFPVNITITSLGNPVANGNIYERSATAPACLTTSNATYSFHSDSARSISYGMTASDAGGHNWTGTFTMYYGYCHLYELQQ